MLNALISWGRNPELEDLYLLGKLHLKENQGFVW